MDWFHTRLCFLCDETYVETGYNPAGLRQILSDKDTWFLKIRQLVMQGVDKPHELDGLQYLIYPKKGEGSRFELSIEALIYDNKDYQRLFSEEEINACKEKLIKLDYIKEDNKAKDKRQKTNN